MTTQSSGYYDNLGHQLALEEIILDGWSFHVP